MGGRMSGFANGRVGAQRAASPAVSSHRGPKFGPRLRRVVGPVGPTACPLGPDACSLTVARRRSHLWRGPGVGSGISRDGQVSPFSHTRRLLRTLRVLAMTRAGEWASEWADVRMRECANARTLSPRSPLPAIRCPLAPDACPLTAARRQSPPFGHAGGRPAGRPDRALRALAMTRGRMGGGILACGAWAPLWEGGRARKR